MVFIATSLPQILKYNAVLILSGIVVGAAIIGIVLLNIVVEVEQRKALENIQVEFADVSIQGIGLTGVNLEVALDMYNPNDVTATLDRSEYELWFNENHLGKGSIDEKTDIPPFTSRLVHSEFNMSYAEVGNTIVSALTEEEHTWRIQGTAHYDSILGTIDIPFDIVR